MIRRTRRLLDPIRYPHTDKPLQHWQRIVLNDDVNTHIKALGPDGLRAVEISGDTHSGRGWKEYSSLMYPEFDICQPIEGADRFDVVICEQVLEHVPDPFLAAANLRALCVPGGRVIVSTPFLIKVHEMQLIHDMRDYWRFTPRGLRTLLERAGLDVDEVGSWGNRDCVVGNFDTWAAFRPWHSLRNEPDLPVQVWAFARRPEERA
ncbi:MAG: methyltransferase domain-containing protein [Solirubrobacterales bacterium]